MIIYVLIRSSSTRVPHLMPFLTLMTEEILKQDPLPSKERQRDRELKPRASSENRHAQSQSPILSVILRPALIVSGQA